MIFPRIQIRWDGALEPQTSTKTDRIEPTEPTIATQDAGPDQTPLEQEPIPGSTTRLSKARSLFKKVLFYPMLYVAILVHGALLAIPGGPEEVELPEDEEEEISITILPTSDAGPELFAEDVPDEPEPEPEPDSPEPPPKIDPPTPPTPAPAPPPVQEQAPPPTPPTEPEPPAEPDPPTEPPAPKFDPSATRAQAASNIENLAETQTAPFEPNQWSPDVYSQFFVTDASGNPERIADADYFNQSGRPQLRDGIIPPITWQNDLRIENVRPGRSITGSPVVPPAPDERITDSKLYLGSLYDETIVVTSAGEYGGGPLFQVATQEGDVIEFLNPVRTKIKTAPSFYLVRWAFNPNEGPPADETPTDP